LRPTDLLATALTLTQAAKGKPTQANLRRAHSTAYYALFHRLAKEAADGFLGGVKPGKTNAAWRQVYRALAHKQCSEACKKKTTMSKFPKSIEDFGNTFVTMQAKRESADYDPFVKLTKSEVIADIQLVEQAIADFNQVAVRDRRAFAAYVLLKGRT
jgi:hypothetical protein